MAKAVLHFTIAGDKLTDAPAFRPSSDGKPGGLVVRLPADRPGLAQAMLTAYAHACRGARDAALSTEPLTPNAIEDAILRQRAGVGIMLASLVVGQYVGGDGDSDRGTDEALALDAARRYRLPDSASCPECGDVRTVVDDGERVCVGCRHRWVEPSDADRFVGEHRDRDFGLAVVDELSRLGVGFGSQVAIAAACQTMLAQIAGIGGGGGVSFT